MFNSRTLSRCDSILTELAPRLAPKQQELDLLALSAGSSRPGCRVQTINTHHIFLAIQNDSFRETLTRADRITADGWPVVMTFRALGFRCSRTTGSDLVKFLVTSRLNGLRVAVVGASEEVGNEFARRVGDKGGYVVFREHGFRGSWDLQAIDKQISEARAQLVLVAVGPPDGEILATKLSKPDGRVTVGVGGALNMYANGVKRAPDLVVALGLEWAFRLAQDPRRLWQRYFLECLPLVIRGLAPLMVLTYVRKLVSSW